MEAKLQQQIAFFLTGRRGNSDLRPLDGRSRPALFAGYRDLNKLRYDFPLVLKAGGTPELCILSLSGLVDDAVEAIADDPDRDRIARHGHRVETEVRRRLSENGRADLETLWNDCAAALAAHDEKVASSAKRLLASFPAAGELASLDVDLPLRVVHHAWKVVQYQKAAAFRQKAERLLLKLHEILEAEISGSAVGRTPDRLKAGVGAAFAGTFNFDAMSNILVAAKPGASLPDTRRRRILRLIEVLESQRFYPLGADAPDPYVFVFDRCADALDAYHERNGEALELLKALAVAELEVSGEYRESVYDVIFQDFGANGLGVEELAKLPDYLVTVNTRSLDAAESSRILELFASGLPVRVLVQTDDILEPSAVYGGNVALRLQSRQLVDTAIGLADVFVMQTSASDLYRSRDALIGSLEFDGPSLISVFSGANEYTGDILPYLIAAAALESRAFPALVYDPSAGDDWAGRLTIKNNPAPEGNWPEHNFSYEDSSLQAKSDRLAFTIADFMVMDERFHEHFAVVPPPDWTDSMVPVPTAVKSESAGLPTEVPSLMFVDEEGRLGRAIMDRRILFETRRCLDVWRSLQELAGINNSHVKRSLAQGSGAMGLDAFSPSEAISSNNGTSPAAPEPAAASDVSSLPVEESHGDEPYIETARCTTCNECTHINNKMFAYNENQQAYIADPTAGTFRELVEAAESCQVSIIHPGKPINPKEPGIEDLLRRAAEFN